MQILGPFGRVIAAPKDLGAKVHEDLFPGIEVSRCRADEAKGWVWAGEEPFPTQANAVARGSRRLLRSVTLMFFVSTLLFGTAANGDENVCGVTPLNDPVRKGCLPIDPNDPSPADCDSGLIEDPYTPGPLGGRTPV